MRLRVFSLRTSSVLCATAILTVFLSSLVRASFLPLDHWAYRDIDALQVRGHRIVSATSIKPYTRNQIAQGVARIACDTTALTSYECQLIGRLMKEFTPDLETRSTRGADVSPDGWWIMADANPRVIVQQNPLRIDQPRSHRLPARTGAAPESLWVVPRDSLWGISTDRARMINTLDLSFHVAPGLSTGQRFEMDSDGLADNEYRGKVKTFRFGSTGQVEQAYLLYEMSWGKVAFGRFPLAWGPGRQGNLHVSDNAPALDMLVASADVRWLHFVGFTGELEWEESGTTNQLIRRFVAGHRLVLTPARWLEIGAAETVVYGGLNSSLALRWSNPLIWFYPEEVNMDAIDDNGLASFDVALRPARGVETYGALLMDDIALDKRSPDKIAWTLGIRWESPLGWDRVGLGLEYTRVTPWVYNAANKYRHLRYVNERAVLGHWLGPDGDALFFTSRWESQRGLRLVGLFTHRRQGKNRFTSRYPVDSQGSNFGYRDEPFPSVFYPGIVETTTTGELHVVSPAFYGLTATLETLVQTSKNAGNHPAPRTWDVGFRLDLDWHIPLRR